MGLQIRIDCVLVADDRCARERNDHGFCLTVKELCNILYKVLYYELRFAHDVCRVHGLPMSDGTNSRAFVNYIFRNNVLFETIRCPIRHISKKNIKNISFLDCLTHGILMERFRNRIAVFIELCTWAAEQSLSLIHI